MEQQPEASIKASTQKASTRATVKPQPATKWKLRPHLRKPQLRKPQLRKPQLRKPQLAQLSATENS